MNTRSGTVNRSVLLFVTILSVLIGLVLIVLTWKNYFYQLSEYIRGNVLSDEKKVDIGVDTNNSGKDNMADEVVQFSPRKLSDFSQKYLSFESDFVDLTPSGSLRSSPIGVRIVEASYSQKRLTLKLYQLQYCSGSGSVSKQRGFYLYEDGQLIIRNEITPEDDKKEVCTVSIQYQIDELEIGENFMVYYQEDDDNISKIPLCWYNEHIYIPGDVYQSTDGCNTCECKKDKSFCTKDKVCSSVDSVESAYASYTNYKIYELPEKDGECSSDSQCYIGGCQNEVCSSKNGLLSNCGLAISKISGVKCSCLGGKCIWNN